MAIKNNQLRISQRIAFRYPSGTGDWLFVDPILALRPLRGLVVLDEIQRVPELFPVLRVLADRPRTPARFLVLGSATPQWLRQSSESLAGRLAFHELGGFSVEEVGAKRIDPLWLRGGFPRSCLARSGPESFDWRLDFLATFLERDLPQLGVSIPSTTLRRFWTMLAHYHGQVWNASEFARSFGVSDMTVRRYLDLLAAPRRTLDDRHAWNPLQVVSNVEQAEMRIRLQQARERIRVLMANLEQQAAAG